MWNVQVYGNIERKIKSLQGDINEIDLKAEEVVLSFDELNSRRMLFADLWKLLKDMECLLKQKSREKWLAEGDANTSFFHACIAARRRKNQLLALQVNENWVENPVQIKEEVRSYFVVAVSDPVWVRPGLDGVEFKQITSSMNSALTMAFNMNELEEAVMGCDGNKATGPNGFNLNFIKKKYWGSIKEDAWGMVEEFYYNAKLPKVITSYFLALVPKCNSPQGLGEYRPFALLGCLYKILAKMLVARLRKVMEGVIDLNQIDFLPGRTF